jgi:hypothetical protein
VKRCAPRPAAQVKKVAQPHDRTQTGLQTEAPAAISRRCGLVFNQQKLKNWKTGFNQRSLKTFAKIKTGLGFIQAPLRKLNCAQ